jgi:hypothetical protein
LAFSFIKFSTGGENYLKTQAGFQRNSGALSPAGTCQFQYIDRKTACPSGGSLMGGQRWCLISSFRIGTAGYPAVVFMYRQPVFPVYE